MGSAQFILKRIATMNPGSAGTPAGALDAPKIAGKGAGAPRFMEGPEWQVRAAVRLGGSLAG